LKVKEESQSHGWKGKEEKKREKERENGLPPVLLSAVSTGRDFMTSVI
jgi:hypothetical protein